MRIISIIILAFLLACGGVEKRAENPHLNALLNLVPESSNVIVYANFNELNNSEFFKKGYVDSLDIMDDDYSHYLEFVEESGFDPKKHLSEAVFAGNVNVSDENDKNFVVVAHAKLEKEKMYEFLKKESTEGKRKRSHVSMEKINNSDAIVIETDSSENVFTAVFLADNIVILGEKKLVSEVLLEKKHILDNEIMADRIEQVRFNQMFTVVKTDIIKRKLKDENNLTRQLDFVDELSFGLNVDDDIHLKMLTSCIDSEKADDVKTAIEGLIAIARLGVSNERDLIDLMNEVRIDKKGKHVSVKLDITQERIEKLKNYRKNIMKRLI
jgi:hypothetical protein